MASVDEQTVELQVVLLQREDAVVDELQLPEVDLFAHVQVLDLKSLLDVIESVRKREEKISEWHLT